jgi:hypothetical protein
MGTDGNSSGGVPYTSTIASCTTTNGATGCAASPPEVTAVSGAQMGGGQLLSQTGISLPAGSTLVIEEDVVFTAPRCGGLIVTNQATVSLGAPPQNDANGSNDEASVSLTLNSVGACVVARNTLSTTKILVNPADTVIDTEGEVVRYLIRSEYTSPDVPVAGIFYGDSFLYFNQNGSTATDAGPALTHEIWITGCTVDALGTGSACPPGPYPRQLQGPSTTFASNRFSFGDGSINGSGSIATGGFVQLALEERWSGIPACLGDRKSVKNQLDSVLIMPPNAPYQNFAVLTSSPTSAAVRIDPDVPACVDIASNKRVTPTNPTADFPMTFGLQFTNNSLAAVGFANTATNVTVTDTLSSSFTPTAVSCSVTSGTATAPTVSLANITGPTHVFSAVIPSMDDGSTVTCSITGVASSPGSFSNTVTANGTSGTGRTGNYDSIANNNSSTVNYGLIAPATVSLTKTISGAVDGYVAGSTFPVTVSCVVTPAAGGAATTVPQTVNLVPNVAQTLSIPPTTGEQNVACSVTEGAAPATASSGFTYGTPAITPVSFAAPAGGSAAPAVTVNNPLSQAMGSLTVTPTVSGAVAGYGGQPFAITVNCTGPGVAGFPQTLNLVANASQSVPVPLGGDCTVSETQPPANSGYAFNAPTYSAAASVIITGDNTIDIQNVLVSAAAPAPVATPLLDLKMLIGLMVLMLVLGVFTARQRMR